MGILRGSKFLSDIVFFELFLTPFLEGTLADMFRSAANIVDIVDVIVLVSVVSGITIFNLLFIDK